MSEASFRNYGRMSFDQKVSEAIDTIKMGKRRLVDSESLINSFFAGNREDQSLIRDGLFQLQQGIELTTKGIIQYYGDSYLEEHRTKANAALLENINLPEIQKHLSETCGIMEDDMFSYECHKIATSEARYKTTRFDNNFLNNAQKVRDILLRYINVYILFED